MVSIFVPKFNLDGDRYGHRNLGHQNVIFFTGCLQAHQVRICGWTDI